MFIRTSHNTFISKCAKKHSHKALILCTTELEVGDMFVLAIYWIKNYRYLSLMENIYGLEHVLDVKCKQNAPYCLIGSS